MHAQPEGGEDTVEEERERDKEGQGEKEEGKGQGGREGGRRTEGGMR